MPYSKTTWVNDTAPAINATNLNKLETQYETAQVDFAPIVGTGSILTASWTRSGLIDGFTSTALVTTSFASSSYIPFVNFSTASYLIAQNAGINLVASTTNGINFYAANAAPTSVITFNYIYLKG